METAIKDTQKVQQEEELAKKRKRHQFFSPHVFSEEHFPISQKCNGFLHKS